MPLRSLLLQAKSFASPIADHVFTLATSVGMGLFSGICYILGTAPAEMGKVVLNEHTRIEGSPNALYAIIFAVIGATAFVVTIYNSTRSDIKTLTSAVEDLKDTLEKLGNEHAKVLQWKASVQTHIEGCPVHVSRTSRQAFTDFYQL